MRKAAQLNPVSPRKKAGAGKTRNVRYPLTTVDLFCGAGGITEGFREAGYRCLYGNDCMPEAIETFSLNHPEPWSDARSIEAVKPAQESNVDYWKPKLERNQARDGENVAALAVIGWESLIVWERETADAHSLKNRLKAFLGGKYQ